MPEPISDSSAIPPSSAFAPVISKQLPVTGAVLATQPSLPQVPKLNIRTSLRASTGDAVFATMMGCATGGALLSNFLVELQASPIAIGVISAVPMLANLLQPVGAYIADRMTSRFRYDLWIYGPARLLWLVPAIGIAWSSSQQVNPQILVWLTVATVTLYSFWIALGSASWMSWMAALVPRRLRGRYFSIRNSAASLTNLLCLPLLGLVVSTWPSGSLQGYAALLIFGVLTGAISLACQGFMTDVNPQTQKVEQEKQKLLASPQSDSPQSDVKNGETSQTRLWHDRNFLIFLAYFGLWVGAVNVSAPFFNIYMLDNLALDVSWVTVYSSLGAAANLILMILWGKIADRTGNRPLLLLVGILVAVTPLFWLGVSNTSLDCWLWLPLLHILAGGTWAAIDLCNNNIQMELAPVRDQATYFSLVAAVGGVSGALGAAAGGFLTQFAEGGFLGLFALSSVMRLLALLPLVLVQEERSHSTREIIKSFLNDKLKLMPGSVSPRDNASE